MECGGRYEGASGRLKAEPSQVERAKLLFQLMEDRRTMEENLKAMTTLTLKLHEKVKRERANPDPKGSNREAINDEIDPEEAEEQRSPLEKELEYKKLVVYAFEKTFFKMVGSERQEVNKARRDLNNRKF